jgi:hypothetical protein
MHVIRERGATNFWKVRQNMHGLGVYGKCPAGTGHHNLRVPEFAVISNFESAVSFTDIYSMRTQT